MCVFFIIGIGKLDNVVKSQDISIHLHQKPLILPRTTTIGGPRTVGGPRTIGGPRWTIIYNFELSYCLQPFGGQPSLLQPVTIASVYCEMHGWKIHACPKASAKVGIPLLCTILDSSSNKNVHNTPSFNLLYHQGFN
ncbi:hypothetical protein RYX36_016294 [Vicia faba]